MVDADGGSACGLALTSYPLPFTASYNILTEGVPSICAVPETWSTLTESTPLTLSIAA